MNKNEEDPKVRAKVKMKEPDLCRYDAANLPMELKTDQLASIISKVLAKMARTQASSRGGASGCVNFVPTRPTLGICYGGEVRLNSPISPPLLVYERESF